MTDAVVCVGQMGDGYLSGPFLEEAGIASSIDAAAGEKYRFKPCLVIPSLKPAWIKMREYVSSFPAADRAEIFGQGYY